MRPAMKIFHLLALSALLSIAATPQARALEFLDRMVGFAEQQLVVRARNPDDPPPFRVGLVLPQRGALQEAAERILTGWRIAVALSDGYVAERPVELVAIDSSASPEAAILAARKAAKGAPIDVYAGVIGARIADAMIAFSERENRPLVLAGAIGEETLAETCRPHVARTSFSIGPYASTSGRFIAGKYGTLVTMAPETEGSFRILRRFTDAYRAAGGRIIEQIWASAGTNYDWTALLARASEQGPSLIYAFFEERNAERIVYRHSTTALKESVALTGPEWLFGPRSLVRRARHADGNRFLTSHLPTADEPANRLFVEAYRAAAKQDPDIYAYMGYENALAVLLTAAGLKGRVEDGPSFVQAMKATDYTGLMPRGTYAFNAVNSAVLTRLYWVEAVHDGKETRLRELSSIPVDEDDATCSGRTG